MLSTKQVPAECAYLGVDITDRFVANSRPIDVCGLEVFAGGLVAHFWTWHWAGRYELSVDVSDLLPEVMNARWALLDGPQGLACNGQPARAAERDLRTPGRTPDARAAISGPYGGYIASSLDLFDALWWAGLSVSAPEPPGVFEVYPAEIWRRLTEGLPPKRTPEGRQARARLLQMLGVRLPDRELTHDQLDACAAAAVGAAADGLIPGMSVERVGREVLRDESNQVLREGPILVPTVSATLRKELSAGSFETANGTRTAGMTAGPTHEGLSISGTRSERARQLFEYLVACLQAGAPTLCTYRAGIHLVLEYPKVTPAHVGQLLSLAVVGPVAESERFGRVRLDTFLVSGRTGEPGDGYFRTSMHTRGEWSAIFEGARLID